MSTDDTAGTKSQGGAQSGGPTEPPGAPKRPMPTIELHAEEVAVSAPAAEAEEDHAAKAETATAGTRAEERVRAFTAPQPTRPSELRGFFTHLAAGLLGGLVGVIAVGYALDRLPLGNLLKSLQTLPPIEAAKIAAIESRLTEVQAVAEQARQQSLALNVGDVQDRLARLEATLKSLGETAKDGGGELAQAAALASRITELGDRMDTELSGLKSQIASLREGATVTSTLRSDLAKLSADLDSLRLRVGQQAASPPVPAQLTEQLDTFGQRLAGLEQDVQRAGQAAQAGGSQARMAAFALAYANLERAVNAGRPYASELEAVEALAPAGTDLAPLRDRAAQGIPTLRDLQASFEAAARTALAAEPVPAADTWIGKLIANARSVVTVQRISPQAGSDTGSTLARMGERVRAGDIAGAVREGTSLAGPPRQAMQPWLQAAQARLAAIGRLNAIETQLMSSLGAGAAAPAGQ